MYFLIYGFLGLLTSFIVARLGKVESSIAKTIMFSGSFLVTGWIGWGVMPTMSPDFIGNYIVFCAVATVSCLLFGTAETTMGGRFFKSALPAIILLTMIIFLPFLTTTPMFHADRFHKILGEPKTSQFSADVSPVNINQVRRVDQALAKRLGEKRIEEIPGLGSRVDLGTMNIQVINGCFGIRDGNDNERDVCFENKLMWAGPLIHEGLFKYLSYGHTPGYIMISAIDPAEVYMVMAVKQIDDVGQIKKTSNRMGTKDVQQNGYEKIEIKYLLNGGYFGSYVERRVRTSGYASDGLTDYSFEIDNNGHPHWIITRFEKVVGFGGENAIGVFDVDAQSGKVKKYNIENAPKWIDRIQPERIVDDQLDDWGKYRHGWVNSWIAKRDLVTTTNGSLLVFGADGKSYWYSGLQSAGSSQGTNSFVLVDTRTKNVLRYEIAGANETAAMRSAENAKGVREASYEATNPVLYNVQGTPTYFMTLKGGDGLVKMYALVSVENYETVGVGKSPREALRDYQNALTKQGGLNVEDLTKLIPIKAVVTGAVREEGFFYLTLKGYEGKEFFGTSELSPELKWTKQNHLVNLQANIGNSPSVPILVFDNLDLGLSTKIIN